MNGEGKIKDKKIMEAKKQLAEVGTREEGDNKKQRELKVSVGGGVCLE